MWQLLVDPLFSKLVWIDQFWSAPWGCCSVDLIFCLPSITKIFCAICSFYFLYKFSQCESLSFSLKITLFSFRKGLFLGTSVIICLSFLTVGIFLGLRNKGLIPKYLVAHFDFIPMLMIIVAYMGYGFGFGVIPGLLAAERTPVQIRYNVDPI